MLMFKYGDRIRHRDVNGRVWNGEYIQAVGYDNAIVRLDEGFQSQAVHLLTITRYAVNVVRG
jgi:hypothetical protein